MASNITLSAGVRQNLLALQNTANLLSTTQNRLATGKKVNSALDNPTNFFTSSALSSRASDLSAILDSMSNGISTLQAANNGLTSITNTVQSMQATINQARQDSSFKSSSYTVDENTIGIATSKFLTLSGGSVGTAVNVALQSNTGGTPVAATAATTTGGTFTAMNFTNSAATSGVVTGTTFSAMNFTNVAAQAASITGGSNFTSVDVSGGDKSFTLDIGAGAVTVNLTQAASGGDDAYSAAEIQTQVDTALGGSGIVNVTGGGGSAPLTFTTVATGNSAEVTIAGTDVADLGFVANDTDTGADAVNPTLTFNVAIDGGANTTVTINQAAVQNVGNNNTTIDTAAELQAIVDAQLGNAVTVSTAGAGTQLRLTSNTTGNGSSVAISGLTATGVANTSGLTNTTQTGANAVTPTLTFDIAIDGGSTRSVTINQAAVQAVGNNDATIDTATELDAIIDAQLDNSVTVDVNVAAIRFTSATTGSGSSIAISGVTATDITNTTGIANTTVAGTPASVSGGTNTVNTVDQLVASINNNSSLTGKVKASNDNGKLSIQNLSTEDLSLAGIGSSSGQIDGSAGTATISGNSVRKNLITQFNQLRTQLDKLADDASFNGINLLRGDTLKLTFNETNTSSINIVSQNANGINTSVLGIGSASGTEFSDNASLDSRSDALSSALTQLRSQASAFGSNLSIVQNRQDFTKAMINTLTTGSDNLVLADTNEEAANLLALQTRQQLSTTALSLANQTEQAVLRLF